MWTPSGASKLWTGCMEMCWAFLTQCLAFRYNGHLEQLHVPCSSQSCNADNNVAIDPYLATNGTLTHSLYFCTVLHAAMCDYSAQRGVSCVCLSKRVCTCAQVPHLPAALKDLGADGGWPRPSTCANRTGQDFFRYMRSALTAVGLVTKQNHVTGYTVYACQLKHVCQYCNSPLTVSRAWTHVWLMSTPCRSSELPVAYGAFQPQVGCAGPDCMTDVPSSLESVASKRGQCLQPNDLMTAYGITTGCQCHQA